LGRPTARKEGQRIVQWLFLTPRPELEALRFLVSICSGGGGWDAAGVVLEVLSSSMGITVPGIDNGDNTARMTCRQQSG
jgi:hypothetical protein